MSFYRFWCLSPLILTLVASALPAQDSRKTKDVLTVARNLGQGRFAGFTHGTKAKQVDCVTYLLAVVEELAAHKKLKISKKTRGELLISHLSKDELAKLQELVAKEDPRIRGVHQALINAKLGKAVKRKDARPGDFIQYWYKSGTKWFGHAGIVEHVKNGKATIWGCHKSTLQSERKLPKKNRKGGIGSGPVFDLKDEKRKVFLVRWIR